MNRDELVQYVLDLGQPAYRARQIWDWLYKQYIEDIDQMSTLPASMRGDLKAEASLGNFHIEARQRSSDGQTTKVLFRLADGKFIETVLMRYEKRKTICISTQAGCAMGCVFCATGQMGFMRNLTTAEILMQVIYFSRLLDKSGGQRLTNIVMIGMREPLHNYDNVMKSLDILTDADGFRLGARKITLSTVGLIPAILRYADEERQTPLAISLHAATDEERDKLIPLNRRWPLGDLMNACHYYINKTGRRLTFEWALINGENDTMDQATRLGDLLKGMLCHVNLIPLNPTAGYKGYPSSRARVSAFRHVLNEYGISSTVRIRRGIDIQAGCGQLRVQAAEAQMNLAKNPQRAER
jgi:23S rRNA (adenine2503-C2)-methyltransferase